MGIVRQYLSIQDKKIAFTYAPASDGAEPCLVFLHGLQSRKEIFDELRLNLEKSFPFSYLAMDFIGFGESDKPEDFSYDIIDQADIVKKLLKEIGIKRVIIIGHSLGGMVGTLLLEQDLTIDALISMEGNLCLEDCGESRVVADMSFEHFRSTYFSSLKERLKTSNETSAPFRCTAIDLIPDYVFYKTAKSIVQWSKEEKLFDIFQTSSQPKLLICGEKSSFKSLPQNEHIKHATIKRAGHFMILDNPQECIKVIGDFLKNI